MPLIYDLSVSEEALDVDETLKTYVTNCLLSNARAQPGDSVPDAGDLQGYWADSYSRVPGDRFGSRTWTLYGRGIDDALLSEYDEMVREALQPLIDDGVVDEIQLQHEVGGEHRINTRVGIRRERDATLTWLGAWEANLASI